MLSENTRIALAALAVYRVSMMITEESGPFEVFDKFRGLLPDNDFSPAPRWVGEGIRCPLCVSFWISLVAALVAGGRVSYLPKALAIAGLAALMHKMSDAS